MLDLLTLQEVCRRLALSSSTIHRLIKKGLLRPLRVGQDGRRLRFTEAEVSRYLRNLGNDLADPDKATEVAAAR